MTLIAREIGCVVNAAELLRGILSTGVYGDTLALQSWLTMYYRLGSAQLPESLSDVGRYFEDSRSEYRRFGHMDVSLTDVEKTLKSMMDAGEVIIIPPYMEYRLAKISPAGPVDRFFTGYEFREQPLQYIRSRLIHFCRSHNFPDADREDIVIAVTEAAENAIKYTETYVVYVCFRFEYGTFRVEIYNGMIADAISDGFESEKFSADASLMRGVLVMSKLLDSLDIHRNEKANRVEFIGHKVIQPGIRNIPV